jgi:hypothetical protein
MLRKFLFLSLTLLITSSLSAYEVQGYFEPVSGKEMVIKQGDFFTGVIRLWPFPNAEEDAFKKLEGATFLHSFTFVELESFSYSTNNPDVLIVKATFVLQNVFPQKDFYLWEYRDLNIPLEIRNITPKEYKVKDSTFVLYKQDVEARTKDFTILYISLLVFCLLLVFEYYRYNQRKERQLKTDQQFQQQVSYWNTQFIDASEREAFEEIYKCRDQWMKIIGMKTPPMVDFFRSVKMHQYKREWNGEENDDVIGNFDQIRGIFS